MAPLIPSFFFYNKKISFKEKIVYDVIDNFFLKKN
jgi:hypothetical protein